MNAPAVYGDVVRYRDLFANLFRRDLQAKYRGSALGVLWTVANPVMLMGVYLLVFGVIWKSPFANGDNYALFLLSGLAVWTFFTAALLSSTRSMLDNANLIRKTKFPRQLVPLSVVAALNEGTRAPYVSGANPEQEREKELGINEHVHSMWAYLWAFARAGLRPLRLEYAEGPAELERRRIAGKLLRLGALPSTLWALNAYPYAGLSLYARKRG